MSDKIALVCDGTPAIGAAIRKSITDKENVLAKWPDARECYTFQYGEEIKAVGSGDRQIHGTGKTFKAAWADAARRLEDGK